ncbi:hypothetical protein AB6806_23930 [Bosea sp. RCC_152_1]|uniref:hypothetical protein n=1 Tax=Bosea sp. RCC_152_1 TaxID=3239228 RepID=UPI0035237D31
MKVRVEWMGRVRAWRLYDPRTRKVMGYATRVLMRDVAFLAPNITGTLEAADWADMEPGLTQPGYWYGWAMTAQANNAYSAAAGRLGKFVHAATDDREFTQDAAEMALLTHTPGGRAKRKAAILAFDPCQMTAEESARAKQ